MTLNKDGPVASRLPPQAVATDKSERCSYPGCGAPLRGRADQRYCSDKHRFLDWDRLHPRAPLLAIAEAPEAHARTTDPETSHEAAKSVRNFTATYQAIVALLEIHGSLTDSSIEALYSGPRASSSGLRTRRSELCSMGIIRDSGVRKRLDSGRWSILWELA